MKNISTTKSDITRGRNLKTKVEFALSDFSFYIKRRNKFLKPNQKIFISYNRNWAEKTVWKLNIRSNKFTYNGNDFIKVCIVSNPDNKTFNIKLFVCTKRGNGYSFNSAYKTYKVNLPFTLPYLIKIYNFVYHVYLNLKDLPKKETINYIFNILYGYINGGQVFVPVSKKLKKGNVI